MKTRLLMIEDSDAQRKIFAAGLRAGGYEVYEAWSVESALRLLPSVAPKVVLLDLKLGEEDSGELLEELSSRNLAVIVVSAIEHVDRRVKCLEAGALDYVTKPVDMRELLLLLARLERLLPHDKEMHLEIDLGCMRFDIASRQLMSNDGQEAFLSKAEFNLLMILLNSKGTVLSRSLISEKVLNAQYVADNRSVDLIVSKLRRKLKLLGLESALSSVRNKGYRLWDEKLIFPTHSLTVGQASR